ncbi:MAG: hypothetical protein ACSHW0_02350 [Thalassotalea sp.]
MEINLWVFLTSGVIFGVPLVIVAALLGNKTKMKMLEIEALKIQKANLTAEVEDAVDRKLAAQLTRIEILEAIVTDKNYELNDKISKLK